MDIAGDTAGRITAECELTLRLVNWPPSGKARIDGNGPSQHTLTFAIDVYDFSGFRPRLVGCFDAHPPPCAHDRKKELGGRLRAAAERLRGKKDDNEPGGGGKKATKPAKGTARRATTPRKAGGS